MKYIVIFGLVTVINFSIAAPSVDIDQFLNELTEIHVRMGEVIERAKNEVRGAKANESTILIAPNGLSNNANDEKPYENTFDAVVDQIHPKDRDGSNNFNEAESVENVLDQYVGLHQDQENINHDLGSDYGRQNETGAINIGEDQKSIVGHALDVIGNEWNDWFGKEKKVVVEEGNFEISSVDSVQNINTNFTDGIHNQPNHLIEQRSETNNTLPSQPLNNTELDNQMDGNLEELAKQDCDHGEDWGEETFNNEGQVDGHDGWFDEAIDSIVGFFS